MTNNVEVLNGFYVPEEGFLTSGRPNIDWGLQAPSDNTAVSFAGGLQGSNTGNMSGMQIPELDLTPQRKRRAGSNIAALGLVDIIEGLSGDPNAYIGRSMARANAFDEERTKEDPEGYQIDLNRAKVLSQRAYQETDPAIKAIYGREIKKLLPKETQGLDDLTAADMFTSNEKIELERAKTAGRLAVEQAKGQNKLSQIDAKAAHTMDQIIRRGEIQAEQKGLDRALRLAIKQGDWEMAQRLQDQKDALTREGWDVEHQNDMARLAYEYEQDFAMEEVKSQYKQEEAAQKHGYSMELQQERTKGRLAEKAMEPLTKGRASSGSAKATEKQIEAQKARARTKYLSSPEMREKMRKLNQEAGRWAYQSDEVKGLSTLIGRLTTRIMPGEDYTIAKNNNTVRAQAYQQWEGWAKQLAGSTIKELTSGQISNFEQQRFDEMIGAAPSLDWKAREELLDMFINSLYASYGDGSGHVDNEPMSQKMLDAAVRVENSSPKYFENGEVGL